MTVMTVLDTYIWRPARHLDALILINAAGFIFLMAAVLIAHNAPATSFEKSIYTSTPPAFWGFLLTSVFIGIFTIVQQVFTGRGGRTWIVAFSLLLFGNAVFFLLPALRGYAFLGKADALTHLGMSMDILQSGHLSPGNFYPHVHLLIAELSQVLDISPFTAGMYFPAYFPILFMLFTLLLTRAITSSTDKILIIAAASCIVLPIGAGAVFSEVHPASLFIMFSPLVLAVYFYAVRYGRYRFEYTVFFIMLMIFFAFAHQLVAMTIILILLFFELARSFLRRYQYEDIDGNMYLPEPRRLGPIVVLALTSLAWVMHFPLFAGEVQETWSFLRGDMFEIKTAEHVGSRLTEVEVHGFQVLVLYLKMYGDKIVFIVFSLAYIIFNLRELRQKRIHFTEFAIMVGCVPILFLILITMARHRVASPFREMALGMTMLTVLGGMGLLEVAGRYIRPGLRSIIVTLVVFGTFGISLMTAYHSSYYLAASHHVTHMELAGFEHTLELKQPGLQTSSMGTTSVFKVGKAVLGTEVRGRAGQGRMVPISAFETPENIHNLYYQHGHFLLTERDRAVNVELWGEMDEGLFHRLDDVASLDKCYENPEFKYWKML